MPRFLRDTIPADIRRGLDRLDPLPATAQKLVAMASGAEVSLAKIGELIEHDQAIAAAVLRASRSARYAGMHTPTTVRDAVMRLGTVPLLNLVMGDYMQRLRVAAPPYGLSESDLWSHAAAAQLAVRAIRMEPHAKPLPGAAETAALLHDVGKLVMARQVKATPDTIHDYASARGLTFVEAERALFGIDHAAVGGAVAELWDFPEEVTHAIGHHHDSHPEGGLVLDAVIVANVVAKSIGAGLGAEGLNFRFDGLSAARLGLDFNAIARICLQTDAALKDVHALAA